MPRALRYYIDVSEDNAIDAAEWAQIARLQHWYNSEFIWSCDKIGLKRYILFPNYDTIPGMPYHTAKYHFRRRLLAKKIELQDELAAVRAMEEQGLFTVRWGGVRDDSLASGITHVADNEFNAYLLCEFLLKCSMIARGATFVAEDEGRFILTRRAAFREGEVLIRREDAYAEGEEIKLEAPQVFSVVNPSRYDEHPRFRQSLEDIDDADDEIVAETAQRFGDLGFAQNYETAWGDNEGLNLQLRARKVTVV